MNMVGELNLATWDCGGHEVFPNTHMVAPDHL